MVGTTIRGRGRVIAELARRWTSDRGSGQNTPRGEASRRAGRRSDPVRHPAGLAGTGLPSQLLAAPPVSFFTSTTSSFVRPPWTPARGFVVKSAPLAESWRHQIGGAGARPMTRLIEAVRAQAPRPSGPSFRSSRRRPQAQYHAEIGRCWGSIGDRASHLRRCSTGYGRRLRAQAEPPYSVPPVDRLGRVAVTAR